MPWLLWRYGDVFSRNFLAQCIIMSYKGKALRTFRDRHLKLTFIIIIIIVIIVVVVIIIVSIPICTICIWLPQGNQKLLCAN